MCVINMIPRSRVVYERMLIDLLKGEYVCFCLHDIFVINLNAQFHIQIYLDFKLYIIILTFINNCEMKFLR